MFEIVVSWGADVVYVETFGRKPTARLTLLERLHDVVDTRLPRLRFPYDHVLVRHVQGDVVISRAVA